MESAFKEYHYQPGVITNIVFKVDYVESKAQFLLHAKNLKLKVIEITEEGYEKVKKNIFNIQNNIFSPYDLCYIDTNNFGFTKTKLILVILEQVLTSKAVVAFSSDEIYGLKLTQMKFEKLSYPSEVQPKKLGNIKVQLANYFTDVKTKIAEVNKTLDEYDEYQKAQNKKQKPKKEKIIKEKIDEAKDLGPQSLKSYKLNIIFMILFAILSTLSGFFTLSNSRDTLFSSTIEGGISQLHRDGGDAVRMTIETAENDYNLHLLRYNQEQAFDQDVIPYMTFSTDLRFSPSALDISPILLPTATINAPNFLKFGFTLLNDESVTSMDPGVIDVILPEHIVTSIFNPAEGETSADYVGHSFVVNYSFVTLTLNVSNVITTSNPQFSRFYPNFAVFFDKPSQVSNTSVKYSVFFDPDQADIANYLKAFFPDKIVGYQIHFTYIDSNNQVVLEKFTLNNLNNILASDTADYTMEIAFAGIGLLIAFFMVRITLSLTKVFGKQTKELLILSAIGLSAIGINYLLIFLMRVFSNQSVLSISLFNIFGYIFSLLLVFALFISLWYQKIILIFTNTNKEK